MGDWALVRGLVRVLVNPGWAPLGVVLAHLVLAELGLTDRFDRVLHFAGGAAIAYFALGLAVRARGRFVKAPLWFLYLFAFTATCTVAVFWEFAEFASDRFMGTAVQRGLEGTILDLIYGVLGALGCLVVSVAFRKLSTRRAPE